MQVRSAGGKTLVHCVSGVSRSASLCLAYLMKHERMPLRRAFAHLKSRRPSVRPNTGFFTQLIEYERRVFGAATVSMVYNPAAGMLIPDVYEPEYQKMLWYQQHYRCSSVRHWWNVYWGILLRTGPQDCTDGFTTIRHIMRKTIFLAVATYLLYTGHISVHYSNELSELMYGHTLCTVHPNITNLVSASDKQTRFTQNKSKSFSFHLKNFL